MIDTQRHNRFPFLFSQRRSLIFSCVTLRVCRRFSMCPHTSQFDSFKNQFASALRRGNGTHIKTWCARSSDCVDSPTLRRTTELLNEGVGGAAGEEEEEEDRERQEERISGDRQTGGTGRLTQRIGWRRGRHLARLRRPRPPPLESRPPSLLPCRPLSACLFSLARLTDVSIYPFLNGRESQREEEGKRQERRSADDGEEF